jgi:hypothetical protein
LAEIAPEAIGMPGTIHGFDDSPNNKFPTFPAAGSEENMKVVLAILSSIKFIKLSRRKWTETLGTPGNSNI